MAHMDTQTEAELKAVYSAFASFGSSQLEGKNFIKLAKEAKLLSKVLTTVDIDLIFAKVKAKGARKITWPEFVKALDHIAAKKGCAVDEVVAVVIKSTGPQDNGTKAEACRFHDDKSQYTGVYACGGPTNVDMDPKNLAGICDRSSADVRGVKTSAPAAANRHSTGDVKITAAR
ncbi:putative p25-alpha family protein [Scenedesmus sp. NREL 46B-D3]|nr:putative p25-alpha family protein [Scenedesmus sp. NREL 46B-D3]